MKVFSLKAENVKEITKQEFKRCDELCDKDIVDRFSTKTYQIFLTSSGDILLNGEPKFTKNKSYSYQSIHSLIKNKAIKKVSISSKLFAILTQDGCVYVCGQGYSNTIIPLNQTNVIDISVSKNALLVGAGASATVYFTLTNTKEYKLPTGKTIKSVHSTASQYILLLSDNRLYSTEPVAGNKLLACGDLYLVSSFLSSSVREVYNSHERIIGIDSYHNIVHMHVGAREQFTYDFPMFHRPITQIGVFSDELLLILSCGELYSIAFSGPSSNSYIRINSPSMIDHFSVSKNEIFIFTSETVPTPALTVYARGYDWFTVDTAQLERIGFESGDRVRAPNDNVATIVGTAFDGSKLCYFDEYTQEIKFSDILSIGTYLFDWRLESRAGADIRNFSFGCGGDLQLDVSAKALAKISHFRSGDVIEHAHLGRGTVLGARCGSLWIRYSSGIRMCSRANSNQLHTAHKLIARNNVTVKQETDANGDILLYNVEPIKGYELGDVVSCDSFGVGVYSGSADSDHIIRFVSDGELLRVIKGSEEMKIRRSISHYGDCFSDIGGRPIFVDFSQSSHAEFGLYPCDVIRANSQTAFFVGVSTVDGKERAVFSTEFLMKNGFGVGYFEEENFKEKYELIARITKPGKRVKKLSDGRNIELSVDTNDFINQTLLPGDELLVHERHCEVCGISEGQIYVEYHDNNECAALEAEPKLLYRRISVPTKAATAVGECWIDITHCADSGFLPQDKVVYNGKKYKIIGVIDKTNFAAETEDGTIEIVNIPKGNCVEIESSYDKTYELLKKK